RPDHDQGPLSQPRSRPPTISPRDACRCTCRRWRSCGHNFRPEKSNCWRSRTASAPLPRPMFPRSRRPVFPTSHSICLVGLFGPREMSMELRERIAADMRAVVAADRVIGDRLAATGQLLNVGGPAEFAQATEEQREKIAAIAKDLGMKPMQ